MFNLTEKVDNKIFVLFFSLTPILLATLSIISYFVQSNIVMSFDIKNLIIGGAVFSVFLCSPLMLIYVNKIVKDKLINKEEFFYYLFTLFLATFLIAFLSSIIALIFNTPSYLLEGFVTYTFVRLFSAFGVWLAFTLYLYSNGKGKIGAFKYVDQFLENIGFRNSKDKI